MSLIFHLFLMFDLLSASFCVSTGTSLEQKPQGDSGCIPSWISQVSPTVDIPVPHSLCPASALYGPLPSRAPLSQPVSVSPDDEDTGTPSEWISHPCWSCLAAISIESPNSRSRCLHSGYDV